MSGRTPDVFVTSVRSDGAGYAAVGLGWALPEGGWRVRCASRPGAGRLGVFLPPGVSGVLPARVTVHASSGEQIGSGALVAGLRAVMLQMSAWPGRGGACWMQVRVPVGVGFVPVSAARRGGAAGSGDPRRPVH
ncbi:hypothetical protein GCM10008956_40120 [Deinococcus arenae]|uniref:Uncharacterized protein n=1 Tax=Deinococcus arenae TaxID=1452751 RepID=A0A8H9LAR0_9DEIO|nr:MULTISPECIES: hypothetical protein [Deinococcus]GGM60414.1 hypothetical protein GCM10008956_40120 [Deinococcus arenae]